MLYSFLPFLRPLSKQLKFVFQPRLKPTEEEDDMSTEKIVDFSTAKQLKPQKNLLAVL